jgi:hypothetical protein
MASIEKIDDSQPQLFRVEYYTNVGDVTQAIEAAEILNLGVRVHNEWRRDDDDEDDEHQSATMQWVLELSTRPPDVDVEGNDLEASPLIPPPSPELN